MGVPVVDVGVVRMLMRHRRVLMKMRVGLLRVPCEVMRMLMVRIVAVRMPMRQGKMGVRVLMMLGQMQPHPKRHQR